MTIMRWIVLMAVVETMIKDKVVQIKACPFACPSHNVPPTLHIISLVLQRFLFGINFVNVF